MCSCDLDIGRKTSKQTKMVSASSLSGRTARQTESTGAFHPSLPSTSRDPSAALIPFCVQRVRIDSVFVIRLYLLSKSISRANNGYSPPAGRETASEEYSLDWKPKTQQVKIMGKVKPWSTILSSFHDISGCDGKLFRSRMCRGGWHILHLLARHLSGNELERFFLTTSRDVKVSKCRV